MSCADDKPVVNISSSEELEKMVLESSHRDAFTTPAFWMGSYSWEDFIEI